VLIGKPVANDKAYILNGENLCGIGVPGELCISGDGLARGYLNRPELTAEKFVKNPFGEGRMYRTGDLARWLPDGNIEYLGRIDEQVKIRGFRIELGEIESRIREIEGIKDCAVIAREDSTGDKAIYAYYTSDAEVSVSEIRDRLSESLPEYMVPAYMMQIEAIPVTRNGKLDKRALPNIEGKAIREYVAPRNETEEKICAIFSEILNVEKVGVKDSFFELGGHSLRATRLVNRIEAETGRRKREAEGRARECYCREVCN
jgi:acyl-CoA synthetase (AMP-forming)/AMP-acid ligase II